MWHVERLKKDLADTKIWLEDEETRLQAAKDAKDDYLYSLLEVRTKMHRRNITELETAIANFEKKE